MFAASQSGTSRRGLFIGLLVGAMFVVPAAIAWACNPQANISVDRQSVSPGQAITVSGSYFPGRTAISVSSPTGTQSVTTSTAGGFVTTVTAPSTPGNYVISAARTTGGSAPASFRVAAPAAAAPTPDTPSSAPAESSAPAQSSAPTQSAAPAQSATSASSFREPTVSRSSAGREQVARSSTPARAQAPSARRSPAPARQPAPVTSTGQPAFSTPAVAAPVQSFSSAAPVQQEAATGRRTTARQAGSSGEGSSRTTAQAPAASDLTATGDVWDGFVPGRTASLTAGADGMDDGGAGGALTIGIALLALGLLAIVGGFAVAETQRRRALAS